MTTQRMTWRGLGVMALGVAWLFSSSAHADIPKKVQAKFRGKILISDQPLPEDGLTTKEAVKLYKKLDKNVLKGEEFNGVKSWTFFYTAFLKTAPKTSDLSLDFHTADKDNLYVANKGLVVNGNIKIISGKLTISEDDGPSRGKRYHLILRARRGKKEVVVAKTKLTLK